MGADEEATTPHADPTSAACAHSSTPADADRAGRPSREHRHVVLLVEDNVDLRVAMQALLGLEGFELMTASDGAEAVEVLRRGPAPCLILLDLMMPVSDGRDFRRHQLQDPRMAEIPTVLFSAHDGIAQRASELGITDFLPKPADFDALTDMVMRQCTHCTATNGQAEHGSP